MATRIYLVTSNQGAMKLVEATTPSQALRHVAKAHFDVKIAPQKSIVTMMKAGFEVEVATAQEEQLDLKTETVEGEVV